MNRNLIILISILASLILFFGCAATGPQPKIDLNTVDPGSRVKRKGAPLHLKGTPVAVGQQLPSTSLTEAANMQDIDISKEKNSILFLSIVPSLDTKVCEAQTHYLGEQGDKLPAAVQRITISRDTPLAQKRFAEMAKLTDIRYLSDYKEADFGQSTGLLIDELRLLARSVILVDRAGVVRYIQVVPEITHLPDMETAFTFAEKLAKE
jgi:thiol peroxidase